MVKPNAFFVERFRTTIPQSYIHVGGLENYQGDQTRPFGFDWKRRSGLVTLKKSNSWAAELQEFYQTKRARRKAHSIWLEGLGELSCNRSPSRRGIPTRCDYQLNIANKFKRTVWSSFFKQMSDFILGLISWWWLEASCDLPGGMIHLLITVNTIWTEGQVWHSCCRQQPVKQSFERALPHLTPELQILVKQMTMSTAVPHVDEETKAYSLSVNRAGVMDDSGCSRWFICHCKGEKSSLTWEMSRTLSSLMTVHIIWSGKDGHLRNNSSDGPSWRWKFTLHPRLLETLTGKEAVTFQLMVNGPPVSQLMPANINWAEWSGARKRTKTRA